MEMDWLHERRSYLNGEGFPALPAQAPPPL